MRRQNKNTDTTTHDIRGFSLVLPEVQIYLCDPFQGRKNGRNQNARRLDAVQSEKIGLCCVYYFRGMEIEWSNHKPILGYARRKSINDRDISERNRKYEALC
jgi:hypothetical protein